MDYLIKSGQINKDITNH